MKATLLLVLCAAISTAHAAEAETAMMPLGAILQSFFALLIVLGVIAGAAWLLKRTQRLQGTATNILKNVSAVAVGPKERVVVVEVGDTWLVLGVAPGQVQALHTLPKQALPDTATGTPKFSDWLARARAMRNREANERG